MNSGNPLCFSLLFVWFHCAQMVIALKKTQSAKLTWNNVATIQSLHLDKWLAAGKNSYLIIVSDIGHLPCDWYRRIPCQTGTENYPSGKLAHHFDWSWGLEQGKIKPSH